MMGEMCGCEEGRLNNYFKYYKLMKKTVLTMMLLAVAIVVRAQDTAATGYRSFFGSESTEWYWIKPFVDGGSQAWRFVMDEDTVIGGVNYRLIRGYLLSPVDTTDMTGMPFDDYDGALVREDTVAGRLWYRDDNEEV